MTKQVSHLAVWEEVRATMDAQKAHLERAWDVLACEPSVRQLEKDALIAAFREVYEKGKAKTAKLSQSDLDREIGVYEAEIVAIQNIRTPEELSRWKQDESNVSAEAMKASKFFDVFLKQKKESWVAERRAKIEKLKSPQALEQARGEGARLIQEIERFHVPSCLKGERIGCNTQHFDYMGKALFSKSHRQLVTESERLGAERCAIGRFASENRTLSTGLKQRQIDCILRETRTDPELRLYALRRSALSLADEEYAKACQGVAEEQALQRKLSACVDKPETARNQTLADQLRLLLLQGSRKAK